MLDIFGGDGASIQINEGKQADDDIHTHTFDTRLSG